MGVPAYTTHECLFFASRLSLSCVLSRRLTLRGVSGGCCVLPCCACGCCVLQCVAVRCVAVQHTAQHFTCGLVRGVDCESASPHFVS